MLKTVEDQRHLTLNKESSQAAPSACVHQSSGVEQSFMQQLSVGVTVLDFHIQTEDICI